MNKPLARLPIKFIRELAKRLEQKDITLHLSDVAYDKISQNGVDPVFGARPMKRYIQRNLETDIAKKMIEAGIMSDAHIEVDVKDQKFDVEIHKKED